VGLSLPNLLRADAAEPFDAVGLSARVDLGKRPEILLADGDDQLPVDAVGDPLLVTEPEQAIAPLSAESRLQRAGLVVDARVDDAAVVAALVEGEPLFLLEESDSGARSASKDLAGDRQADQSAADDEAVENGLRPGPVSVSFRSS
jgi:hypothetical protein